MKKKIAQVFLLVLMGLFFSVELSAQEKESKYETVTIQTSAICDQCKTRLEKNISFEKGVKSVVLDEKTKELTITFKKEKNDKEKLKKAITKVGYDADEMPADEKAYNRLPDCCKKGVEPH